jgi:hypothetical protein
MQRLTEAAQKEDDRDNVQLTDFALRIKNFPNQDSWSNLATLRVKLHKHLRQIAGVTGKPHNQKGVYIEALADGFQDEHGKAVYGARHDEIVDIQFGVKNFRSYEILQEIEQIGKQGQKLQKQMELMKDDKNYEKVRENTMKKLEDLIATAKLKGELYKQERLNPETGVNGAFVTFRSQEGAARLIEAYDISGILKMRIATVEEERDKMFME